MTERHMITGEKLVDLVRLIDTALESLPPARRQALPTQLDDADPTFTRRLSTASKPPGAELLIDVGRLVRRNAALSTDPDVMPWSASAEARKPSQPVPRVDSESKGHCSGGSTRTRTSLRRATAAIRAAESNDLTEVDDPARGRPTGESWARMVGAPNRRGSHGPVYQEAAG